MRPPGTCGRRFPPFRLGAGSGLAVVNTVLDADHLGELTVTLENTGAGNFASKPGDAVATLVLHAVATPAVEEMDAPRGGRRARRPRAGARLAPCRGPAVFPAHAAV